MSDTSDEFTYSPGVVLILPLELIFLVVIFDYFVRNRFIKYAATFKKKDLLFLQSFEHTYVTGFGPRGDYFLLYARLAFFLYIAGIAVIYNIYYNNSQWRYFATWNAVLMSLYFFTALRCSIAGLLYTTLPDPDLSLFPIRIFQMVSETIGASALFISIADFIFVEDSFTLANASVNFVPLLAMIVELAAGSIYVRYIDIWINASWGALYLIFTWILVSNDVESWPYTILDMSAIDSMGWYSLLLIANMAAFTVWYWLSELKFVVKVRLGIEDGAEVDPNLAEADVVVGERQSLIAAPVGPMI